MSDHSATFLDDQLSKRTSIFGLRLWVVLGVCVGAAFVILLFLLSLWLTSKPRKPSRQFIIPNVSRDIREIKIDREGHGPVHSQPNPCPESEQFSGIEQRALLQKPEEESPIRQHRICTEIGMENKISFPERFGGSSFFHGSGGGEARLGDQLKMVVGPEVSHLGWGHWYTLRELEDSTNGFADGNVIGQGGYGIVYHGVLRDNTQVAVKNLLNNRGQAEKEFEVEVEAIGRVRHKNLVRLLGYCAEGAHRILVHDYVNNGNLEQWLHGNMGTLSPLTWDIRMNIILGTARGLAYLHEGLEPKIVHRDIKSSNILLDKQWNPKLSDFGLAKLLGSDRSYITTRVMGTFGYVAPEYASTGMLNERSDVYSFGILIMEIISARNPIDYCRPPEEVNLVEWLKNMVMERNPEGILDPRLPEKPSRRALKQALVVALRCVDPNIQNRPKMGQIVHMLEVEESPFRDDRIVGKDPAHAHCDNRKDGSIKKQGE